MKVYNFGSINIDYVYRVSHFVRPGETLPSLSLDTVLGGKGANQSVALARAGCNVRHVGRIGQNDRWAGQQLADAGVDTSLLQTVDGPSGHAVIQVDDAGENAIVLYGGANQGFTQADIEALLAESEAGDWLLMQNECNALADAFAIAEQRNLSIAFNPAPMTESVMSLPIEACKLLFVNEVEATQLTKVADEADMQRVLQQRFEQTHIVLTRGTRGARLLADGEVVDAAAPRVNAVDTTGAGDTFVGFYLTSVINQSPAKQSLQRACAAAALSVTREGASPSIPTPKEVDDWLS